MFEMLMNVSDALHNLNYMHIIAMVYVALAFLALFFVAWLTYMASETLQDKLMDFLGKWGEEHPKPVSVGRHWNDHTPDKIDVRDLIKRLHTAKHDVRSHRMPKSRMWSYA